MNLLSIGFMLLFFVVFIYKIEQPKPVPIKLQKVTFPAKLNEGNSND